MKNSTLLERVRGARQDLEGSGPASLRRPGDFERVSIPATDADVLKDWLIAEGAHVVIEIGLAYAASALAVAEALIVTGADDGAHLIIDPLQADAFCDVGWDLLTTTGLQTLCVLIRARSQLALPELVTNGFVADAAFVDGSHIFHNVFLDLVFLGELVRPGGLVILDDCEWPSVETAVNYFERNLGWMHETRDHDTRLRAYRLPDPPVTPSFDKFVPFGMGQSADG